jgi:signal transduction histidine kinase
LDENNTAMAKDLMEMPLEQAASESARVISDCADHLLGLVNDILDFARIETKYVRSIASHLAHWLAHSVATLSQLELEVIPLSMVKEVEKAVSLHAAMAKKKRLNLTTEITISQPLRLGATPLLAMA